MDTEKKEVSQSKAIIRETFQMAWPAVLESFFVALAGMIDSLMVSSIGTYAVAAVGLTTQPKFIGLAPFVAANVAVSAIVARRKGQEDRKGANQTLVAALVFVALAGILVSILCVALADPIIRLCGSNEDTHEAAVIYFQIIMGGMMFNIISLAINAAQRGAGRTRIAMKTNVTVLNGIQNSRDEVSGISLDEEASNMMQFMSAYNAASRLMTTLDQTLDTLINSTGVVGR